MNCVNIRMHGVTKKKVIFFLYMTAAFLHSYLTLFCETALSSQYNLVYKTSYLFPAYDKHKKCKL